MKKLTIKEARQYLQEHDARLLKWRNALIEVPFDDILMMIEPTTLAAQYVDFYRAHPAFSEVCAGARHHHWWKGGLEEHCKEMIGIGFDLLELYPGDMNKINRSDLIIGVFLHDFAKVRMYEPITPEDRLKTPEKFLPKQEFKYVQGAFRKVNHEDWTILQLNKYNVPVTENQWSGVLFSEGGFSDSNFAWGGVSRQSETVFTDNPLAVFLHMLDMFSSQILGKSLYGVPEEVEIKKEVAAVSEG